MQERSYSVFMFGLLALGVLVGSTLAPWGHADAQAAGEPSIVFVEPSDTPRFTKTGDPIEPAETIHPVTVDFPTVVSACVGEPMPVDRETLDVNLHRMLDGTSQQEWDVDLGLWTWDPVEATVTGQVTIGGPDSGQDRSRYGIEVCISNAASTSCAIKGVRFEHPVSGFTAGAYTCKGKSFAQTGAGCSLIPSFAMSLLNEQMATTDFLTIVPSGSQIAGGTAQAQFLGIPLINNIIMPASPDTPGNNVILEEVSVSGLDISGIGLPGTNCSISGSADGSLMGEVTPGQDLDGSIRIYDITLELGGGTGSCDLVAAPTCELHIAFDGNP